MSDLFWKRWVKEYLPQLEHQGWKGIKRNLEYSTSKFLACVSDRTELKRISLSGAVDWLNFSNFWQLNSSTSKEMAVKDRGFEKGMKKRNPCQTGKSIIKQKWGCETSPVYNIVLKYFSRWRRSHSHISMRSYSTHALMNNIRNMTNNVTCWLYASVSMV